MSELRLAGQVTDIFKTISAIIQLILHNKYINSPHLPSYLEMWYNSAVDWEIASGYKLGLDWTIRIYNDCHVQHISWCIYSDDPSNRHNGYIAYSV